MKLLRECSTNIKKTKNNEAGFTLAEVLVTLSVTSLIVMMIAGTFSQFRNLETIRTEVSEKTEITTLINYLRKRLSGAHYLPLLKNNPTRKLIFSGTQRELIFVSEAKRGNVGYGLFDIGLEWNPDTKILYEVHIPRRNSNLADSVATRIELKTHVLEIKFAYRSIDTDAWQTSWQKPNELPSAIRLQGILEFGSANHNLDFVVNLQ